MHRRAFQLEEVESDISAEHIAQSHHSCCLLAMRSIFGDGRVRNQSHDKGLGVGFVGGQREQLRRNRYLWIQRTQICSQLRCKFVDHAPSHPFNWVKTINLSFLMSGFFADRQVSGVGGFATRQHCKRLRLEVESEDRLEQSQCQSGCSVV